MLWLQRGLGSSSRGGQWLLCCSWLQGLCLICCSPMLVDKKSSREEIQMSNMGPGRRGAGRGVGGRELSSPLGMTLPPMEVTWLTVPSPAPDNYSTLNERDHSRTLDRPGDLGDMEPVKAAPLMVSSSS